MSQKSSSRALITWLSVIPSPRQRMILYTLFWFKEPNAYGGAGFWSLSDDKQVLTIVPHAKKDFWRKTYYDPPIVKDDGSVLFAKLPWTLSSMSLASSTSTSSSPENHYTVETKFVLRGVRQFDQAGLMVRLDHDHWLKTGIELVDQQPRLSCVVTNVYSDWSTQPWTDYHVEQADDSANSPATVTVNCHIRVHVQGESLVVEAKTTDGEWDFIRIAHLSKRMISRDDPVQSSEEGNSASHGPEPAGDEVWAGVFACSPEDQQGGSAIFSSFRISQGSSFGHNADGNNG